MSAEPFASRPSPQFNFNLRDLRTLRVPSDLPTSMSSCSYQMRFVLEKVILRLRHRRQRCHRCLDQGRLLHGWHGVTQGFEGGRVGGWLSQRWNPGWKRPRSRAPTRWDLLPSNNWSWNCKNFSFLEGRESGEIFFFLGGEGAGRAIRCLVMMDSDNIMFVATFHVDSLATA